MDRVAALADQAVAALHVLARDPALAQPRPAPPGWAPAAMHAELVVTLLRIGFLLQLEHRGLLPAIEGAGWDGTLDDLAAAIGRRTFPVGAHATAPDTGERRGGEPDTRHAPTNGDAWPRLVARFRAVEARWGGALFATTAAPHLDDAPIADGTVGPVLRLLCTVDDASLPRGQLPVEHLGALYEALLGFTIDDADEVRVVVRAASRRTGARSADPAIGVTTLHALPGASRVDAVAALGVELPPGLAAEVAAARTDDELTAVLLRRASNLAPEPVPPRRLVPQPTAARRRSGSHYTPPALAASAVERTLAPLLAAHDDDLTPDAILALTICDPAMGSGAFLLAACRFLAGAVVSAWDRRRLVSGGATGGVLDRRWAGRMDGGALTDTADGDDVNGDVVDGDPMDGDVIDGEAIDGDPMDGDAPIRARRLVAQRCLHGLDADPLAVEVARTSLWLETRAADHPLTFVDHALHHGDALVGFGAAGRDLEDPLDDTELGGRAALDAAARLRGEARLHTGSADAPTRTRLLAAGEERIAPLRAGLDGAVPAGVSGGVRAFHWAVELPEVFVDGGFHAFVGNPPWVSYAGRAAQPLDPARRAWLARYASFAGYRNLQGVFVERCVTLTRPGGRLGLVLPSSMSEQAGYAPTRIAHDRLAACDDELVDLGEDSFPGVFQPCLVLTSTRRAAAIDAPPGPWPVERPDLDAAARALVARMTAGPLLPPATFGERGLQSSGDDLAHLARAADAVHDVPLRAGGDIRAFFRGPPSFHADRRWFGPRLREPAEYRAVGVLIRQTAAFPIATPSDGVGFRNSILAGFGSDDLPAVALAAYLDASPIRWLHYVRHRDARQGMPQVKIGHLRAIPAPPPRAIPSLEALGARLAARGSGVDADQQAELDAVVADAFDLGAEDRRRIADWAARHVT